MDNRYIPKVGEWFKWSTVSGIEYEGEVIELDGNVAHIKCTDGIIRCVEC